MSNTRTAKDLVATSQRLMDGLLNVEDSAFELLDMGLQQVADATRERIHAAQRISPVKLASTELLPDDRWITGVLMPPVGQLIAVARERSTAVAGRQSQLLAAHVGVGARAAAHHAKETVTATAPEVERVVYMQTTDTVLAAIAPIRAAVAEQRRIWTARHEPLDALVARCCSRERVGLPSATRGAVWGMRAGIHAAARAASVDTCNAVLLSSMRAWNERASVPAA